VSTSTVVIQARTGSSRLPAKVLQDVGGRPMLRFMLERLSSLNSGRAVVVATSDSTADDAIAEVADDAGVPVVRGPEHDVLARIRLAAERFPADDIVRLTADCPLHDPAVVAEVLAHHRRAGAQYTSNTLVRTYPDGLDVEVVQAGALLEADAGADDPGEREHVTPFLYRRPSRFQLAQHTCDDDAGDERWTVDTAEDLEWVRSTVATLDDPVGASWRSVLVSVGRSVPPGRLRLRPVLLPDPVEPGPWVRRWTAIAGESPLGGAAVTVDDGVGRLQLDVRPQDRQAVADLVRRALQADAQVRELVEGDP